MPELLALDGSDDIALPIGALHGIAHPTAENGAATAHGRDNQRIEIAVSQAGTGRIVHQHPLPLRHMEAIEDGEGALGASLYPHNARVGRHGQGLEPAVMGRQRHDHLGDGRVGEQPLQGMFENGFTRQLQVLLGAIGPHSAADTGGRDDRRQAGYPAGISHRRAHRPALSLCLSLWG